MQPADYLLIIGAFFARKYIMKLLRDFKVSARPILALLLVSLGVAPVYGADIQTTSPQLPERPRIGLVLAGGGAKGGAHVGVLKVLEELHVPVDCIAGTSIGALVGAGYASGISAQDLEGFVTGIDWQKVVGGLGRRELEPIEQKRAGVTYSNSLELGIKDGSIMLPGGIVDTSGIEDLLRGYVARARMQPHFDRLPIPFRAIATDMVSGQMVVIDKGDLATAMRASMAIPGAFAPVIMDDYVLSDGGMVRNIPIDVARNLCADTIIVVNLVEPLAVKSDIQSASALLGRSMDVMIQANEDLQLLTLTEQDIRIDVPTGDIGTADFERVPDAIPLGETAARLQTNRLAKLALPEAQYLAWREKINPGKAEESRIAGVRFEGLDRVNAKYLEQALQVREGDIVDLSTISAEAQRMSALQEFESLEYRFEGDLREPELVWLPKEKRWGPDYLDVDLGMYASDDGDVAFVIYAKHSRTWINYLGAEWRNELQLGTESYLVSSLYQPLDVAQRFFVEPRIGWWRSLQDFYFDGDRVANYQFDNWGVGLDAGVNISNRAQARIGYLFTRRDIDVDTGLPLLTADTYNDAGLAFTAIYDSRDTSFNPTKGMAGVLEYLQSDETLGASRDWERIELGLGMALPVGRDVVWFTLAGGSNLGSDLPGDRSFMIGGPGSFPGYELAEVWADEYWSAAGSYLWQVKELMAIRGQALYAGVRLQAGEASDRLDLADEGVVYGGSVYLTGRTPVGPLTVGLGTTSTDAWSLWVAVGRPIGHGTILERGIFR
jgi:NTE family protein